MDCAHSDLVQIKSILCLILSAIFWSDRNFIGAVGWMIIAAIYGVLRW
jgi:hypothetical protein